MADVCVLFVHLLILFLVPLSADSDFSEVLDPTMNEEYRIDGGKDNLARQMLIDEELFDLDKRDFDPSSSSMPGILRFGKRSSERVDPLKRNIPGVLRFGKRDYKAGVPGVLRFGKKNEIPGVLRFGKRDMFDSPGILRFGKRSNIPGVLRFGKKSVPGVLRFG